MGASEVAEVSDLAAGGVDGVGDELVVSEADTENSEAGDASLRDSADITRFLLYLPPLEVSASRSFSWTISASTLSSESSSRSLCASIRRPSRSCSPTLISSSSITPRSIATLYFESRSSSEDVVFRAWRSKSSFATSISLNRSWSVLLVSLRVVISFCKVF